MDLKTFFEHFDTLAEAPNGIQRLRELILDMAVRGKLVPQDPEDEPAKVMLQKLQTIKQELIRRKEIKKERFIFNITEEDFIPEVPQGWELVKLGSLFEIVRGSSPRPKGDPRYFSSKETDFHWIKISDITAFVKDDHLTKTNEYLTFEGTQLSRRVSQEDIIIAASGSVGKSCLLDIEGYIYDGLMAIRRVSSKTLRRYLLHFFKTIELALLREATGTSWKNINTDILKNTIIPLPPLAEQKRIVAKVDELMALCDALEAAQHTRNTLRQSLRASALDTLMNATSDTELDTAWSFVCEHWDTLSQYPEDVEGFRKSILQLAVQGRLVHYQSQSQTVNEDLKRIRENRFNNWLASKSINDSPKQKKEAIKKYKPRQVATTEPSKLLPKHWSWVSPDEIASDDKNSLTIGPFGSNLLKSDYTNSGVPLVFVREIRSKQFGDSNTKFVSPQKATELASHTVQSGDVLITKMGSPPGDTAVYPYKHPDAIITADCIKLTPEDTLSVARYLEYAIDSSCVKSQILSITKGVAHQKVSLRRFRCIGIPLPPSPNKNASSPKSTNSCNSATNSKKTFANNTNKPPPWSPPPSATSPPNQPYALTHD